jgi:hypothetical protein
VQFSGTTFTEIFLLTGVQFPTMGTDFFRHHNLLVNSAADHLNDSKTMQVFTGHRQDCFLPQKGAGGVPDCPQ